MSSILDADLQMAYAEMQVVPGGQLITHVSPIIELSGGVVVVPDRWRIEGNEVVIIMEDDNGNKNRDS